MEAGMKPAVFPRQDERTLADDGDRLHFCSTCAFSQACLDEGMDKGGLRDLPSWQIALDEGRLPVFRGMRLTEDDQLRADLIQRLMCQGEIPIGALERRYLIDFNEYFATALERLRPLVDDGLVRIEPDRITATSRGRLLLRNMAMCFDHYLHTPGPARPADTATPRFSRAI